MDTGNIILNRLIESTIIIVISFIFYKLVNLLLKKAINSANEHNLKVSKEKTTLFYLLSNGVKYVFLIVIALIILQVNGVNVSTMLAGVGIVGVVVGLAIQDALKDIIRGITLLGEDYYKVGDIVKIGDNTGEVVYMGLKTTRIKDMYTLNIVSIANRNIEKVEILSGCLGIDVPMPYEVTLKHAEKVIEEIIQEILKNKYVKEANYRNISKLDESCIKYKIILKVDVKRKLQVDRDVNRVIVDILAKNKIDIPYNQLDIHTK